MSHYMTGLFLFMFGGYIILFFIGADARPMEFLLGVLLFGMLEEIYRNANREPKKTKTLKFKQGDIVMLRIANVKGMIIEVYDHKNDKNDYRFEWWNHVTFKPDRVSLNEFEIKEVNP